MSELDRILDNNNNLEVANRGIQEERIKDAIINAFSKDDWTSLGFTDFNVAMDENPFNKGEVSFKLHGKQTFKGREMVSTVQYDCPNIFTKDSHNPTGLIHAGFHRQDITIPFAVDENTLSEIHKNNSEALVVFLSGMT